MKTASILAFSLALMALAAPAFGQANSALSLINLHVTPQPVTAGSNATVVFQLYNSYSSALTNVNIQVTASNPVINVSPSSSTVLGTIGQGAYGGNTGYDNFVYIFHIPKNTNAGVYTIDVIANYQAPATSSGTSAQVPATSVMPINLYIYGTPSIQLNANPQAQITPGSSAATPITVLNSGTDTAYNLSVTILGSNAFTVSGPNRFSLGSLAVNAQGSISPSLQPSLSITNGTYYINASVSYQTAYGKVMNSTVRIPVQILINPPNIVATVTSASPANIYPGSNQTLQLSISNIGLGTAKNVTVDFTGGSGLTVGSVSNFFIGSLAPGQSEPEMLFISANNTAFTSNYSLTAQISYRSSNYQSNGSIIRSIPISVQKSAIFNITAVKEDLKPGATYAAVTFTVKNIGNADAQQVSFSMQTNYPITPATSNLYLGSLSPGQSANVTFYVDVDQNGNPGVYPIAVYQQWRQPNGAQGQLFSSSENYFSEVKPKGGGGSGLIGDVIIIAVVAVIGGYLYKTRFKKMIAARKERGKETQPAKKK